MHFRLLVGAIRVKNSAREAASLRSWPCSAEVTVVAPDAADATHGHAEMFGFYDDPHTARCYVVLEPVGDLLGQPFLHLGAAREQLDHPSQLGQAENPLPWQVADMGDSDERQQVMLTHRLHRDGAGDDQLVISGVVAKVVRSNERGVNISA